MLEREVHLLLELLHLLSDVELVWVHSEVLHLEGALGDYVLALAIVFTLFQVSLVEKLCSLELLVSLLVLRGYQGAQRDHRSSFLLGQARLNIDGH